MKSSRVILIFIAPAVLVILGVVGWPLLRTVYFSFTNASLGQLDTYNWVGIKNYINLFLDENWWRSVFNTLAFATISVFLETVLGMGLALLLNLPFRGRQVLRTAVLIPWAIPAVVSAKMWAWLFNDLYGFVNYLLLAVGLIKERIAWLANDHLSMTLVVLVDVWKTTPFMALLLLAALQSISPSVIEAAKVDGCPSRKRFLYITLPMIRPALFVAVLFRALDALRVFDLPFILTTNSRSTLTMSVFARQQLIDFQDVGYGSAASLGVFVMIALSTLILIRRIA